MRSRPTLERKTILPEELKTKLADARRPRACDYTEVTAAEVSVWVIELRVIEDIEKLGRGTGHWSIP